MEEPTAAVPSSRPPWLPLRTQRRARQRAPPAPRPPPQPEAVMRAVVNALAQALPSLAARGEWVTLRRATQFLLWLTQHAPGSASMFIAAKGTGRIQEAIRAAASSDHPAAASMLQPGTALLLQCVQLSEGAADLVVESQSVRLLLQLLLRPTVGTITKRHIGGVLQALAATKLVYRDVLHGAGVVDVLMSALTDAALLTDLQLMQELLWVLVSLADDDVVYKDDMREAGLPALLVSLLSVYQAHQGTLPELRPIAAQLLRCLQLMAAGDEAMQVACVGLGLMRLLVVQLHLDIHQLGEPPLPAAASNILTLNSLPGTPKSPHTSSSPFVPPASPLRRSSSGEHGSPRPGSAGPGGRRAAAAGVVEPSIPEDEEADVADEGGLGQHQPGANNKLGGRGATFANHGSEAAALRGLGVGPTTMQRLAAAALLRVVLQPVMSAASIEVLLHGMLLPALHMQLVGPRLSLAAEATCTVHTLLANSPQRAALAAQDGVAPLIVQLLSATNLELATTAADVLTLLATSCPGAVLEQLAAPAVSGLTDLLRECSAQSQTLGLLGRRHSSMDGRSTSTSRRPSLPAALDSPMSPIPEGGSIRGQAGLLSQAEQAAGAVWAAERTSASFEQPPDAVVGRSSVVIRHPSLSSGTQTAGRGRVVSSGGTPSQDHLTSRERQQGGSWRPGISSSTTSTTSSSACLTCGSAGPELCSYCYVSAAVRGLCLVLQPKPELQAAFAEGAGLEVAAGLLAGLVGTGGGGGGQDAVELLRCLCTLLVAATSNNKHAQDQVRLAGGVDVLVAALKHALYGSTHSSSSKQPLPPLEQVAPLVTAVLSLLSVLVSDNSANKLALREAGGFTCVVSILDLVLAQVLQPGSNGSGSKELPEGVAQAVLALLSACLPESPGSQAALHSLGGTRLLLTLLRAPSNSPSLGLSAIHVLSLLANKHQPGTLAEVTAGGLVAVVMNVLQQQAMAGILVSEVCMKALPNLLDGNGPGKHQALQYGVLPLLVHLLRSSPSPATITAAAHTLAVLAERNTELQGQITSAGGLSALLDKLDTSNGTAAATATAAEAHAAAAEAAAEAAATAAAEVVAKAAAETEQQQQEQQQQEQQQQQQDSVGTAAGSDGAAAVEEDGSSQSAALQPLPGSHAAAAMAVAAAATDGAVSDAMHAAAHRRLAAVRVRVACLQAVAALAHDNSFTKNTARQQGGMLLLADLLRHGSSVLQAALLAEAAAGAHSQQQQQQGSRSASPAFGERPGAGLWPHGMHLRVRTPRSSFGINAAAAAAGPSAAEKEQQQEQAAQLQLLVAAVHVLEQLCHGNHSNQQAAATEGLIDQLTLLAAAATGSRLECAGQHVTLLSGLFDALAAVVELCTPNKLVAREVGAVDVASTLLLMVAEVPDVCQVLSELCLAPAVTSCCAAVVALAQDCEDNQAAFVRHPDFLPALFRLLSVSDPAVAAQAARALEFIAVRADIADDADDRSEFEADTVMALIRMLSQGALAISGSGRAAAARAAIGGPGGAPPPSAAAVKEAAALLALVVDASDPSAQQAAAAALAQQAKGAGSGASGGVAAAGLGTAPAHPTPAGAAVGAGARQQQQQPQPQQAGAGTSTGAKATLRPSLLAPNVGGGAGLPTLAGQNSSSQTAAAAAVDGTTTPPHALLPDVVTDHTSGLAVLRTWSLPQDQSGQWQQLVGRSAPAFQMIRGAVPPGPWKVFREQLSWMLLLLASKSSSNRAIISRVQRTTLTPLAMQLENAERFAQQATLHEAEAAALAASTSQPAPSAAPGPQPQHPHSRGNSIDAQDRLRAASLPRSSPAELQQPYSAGSPPGGVQAFLSAAPSPSPPPLPAAASAAPSPGPAEVEDDDLSMLQAEVAFLSSASRVSSNAD